MFKIEHLISNGKNLVFIERWLKAPFKHKKMVRLLRGLLEHLKEDYAKLCITRLMQSKSDETLEFIRNLADYFA
ncbi:MAG: hypothetical protein ACYDEJ_13935 [Desulfitobacteriaceae bacterium]